MLTAPNVSHLASAVASRLVEADMFSTSKFHSEENNMDASVMVAPDIDNHRIVSATCQKIEGISIAVTDVEKRYGNLQVLNGVSFSVPSGTVFGLLGPNGAGKSTLMKILSTVSTLDSGCVRIGNFSVTQQASEVRRMIGVVPQKSGADRALTAVENLWIQGIVYGLRGTALRERIDQLLERFGLSEAAHRVVRNFSGGMVRRLDLAIGLIHRPTVLLLDEPTVGLDPTARAALWQSIQDLSLERITVLLTTHHLEEADYLANTVAIMHHGRIVIQGAPRDLKADLAGDVLEVTLDPPSSGQCLIESLRSMEIFREIQIEENELRVRTDSGTNSAPTLLSALAGIGVKVHSLRISGPSLEDVYKRYTGFRFPAAG